MVRVDGDIIFQLQHFLISLDKIYVSIFYLYILKTHKNEHQR